jgi:hypothetical protein
MNFTIPTSNFPKLHHDTLSAMNMSVISAGLAWAVPVKPDELGASLEAYKKILPSLMALRLCHRFGKGEAAHVTKLPPEILHHIESMMFDPRYAGPWEEYFQHYEGRCEPLDHIYDDARLDMLDKFQDHLCAECQERGEDYSDCWDCYDERTELANDYMMADCEFGLGGKEGCYRSTWEDMIDQKQPKGHFVQYDEVRDVLSPRHQRWRGHYYVSSRIR